MERGLILVFAALMVYLTSGVQGTFHLSFSNNTQVNVTRSGCGTSRLCVETPNDCDPAGNSTCLIVSVGASSPVAPNGTDLTIGLKGDSTGYIALGLTLNASEGTTMLFICGQNNSMFFFRTMKRNNTDNMLTATERIVQEIRGIVNGSMIRCEFNIPGVNATSMTRIASASESTTFNILLGNGTVDGSNLGSFNTLLNSGPLDLANPMSNIATTSAPNVTATTTNSTASGSSDAVQPHAVLLLLSVISLLTMLRA